MAERVNPIEAYHSIASRIETAHSEELSRMREHLRIIGMVADYSPWKFSPDMDTIKSEIAKHRESLATASKAPVAETSPVVTLTVAEAQTVAEALTRAGAWAADKADVPYFATYKGALIGIDNQCFPAMTMLSKKIAEALTAAGQEVK
jgi:hypothetical protein